MTNKQEIIKNKSNKLKKFKKIQNHEKKENINNNLKKNK